MPTVVLGLRVLLICLVIELASSSICPADRVNATHDVVSAINGEVTIQQGIFQRIPCTTFLPGENIAAVIWYQGNSDTDPRRVRLIGMDDEKVNQKYGLTSNNGLIIKNVTKRDEGNYVCIVAPFLTINRYVVIDVHVIEGMFQAVTADVTITSTLTRSVRHRIPCPCDTTSSSTLYWSQGTGVTSETDILCARFPDGTVLQFQGGDDFGVAADGSLILNSLQNTRENARFWCHVFKPDGSLINCYVDAKIVKDEQPSNNALQASKDSFYILKGEDQTLPCTNRPISEQACEVQWFKDVSPTADLLLNYTAWNDVTYGDDGFDLGSDFALVVKSAEEENGGVYTCKTESESQHIEVRVIGDTFPLDKGNISRVEEITFEAGQNYTLECAIGLDTTKSRTAFWSFGQKDAINTTVIGKFKFPDSFVNKESLERNSCYYKITVDGALLLTSCFIDSDVRYWCHVFLDGVLYRYYVDLVVQDSFPSLVAIIIPIIAVVIIMCLVAVLWKCRRIKLIHSNYVMVDVEDYWEAELLGIVKEEVMKRVGRVPITPWATEDTSCYAKITDVFKPLQLFINHKVPNRIIRFQLKSEAEIFDDGISHLISKHVFLEGRAGSGKTTLLHKLAFDMYMGKAEALLGQVIVVFVLPANLLLQHGNLGKAVFQQLGQPNHDKISAESINSFCKNHSIDVAILIDDCDDVGPVTEIIRKQELMGAYVVMTTRQINETDLRFEFHFRHVTVSGFTPASARSYIKCSIDESERSTELIRYLDEHILPPDVECLPLNLTALCQLSLWTNGKVFRHPVGLRTSELFCKLVKCLFDGVAYKTKRPGKGLSSGSGQTMESYQPSQDQQGDGSCQTMEDQQLTQDQQELLVKFGDIAFRILLMDPGTLCELFRQDFDQFGKNKNNAFDEGVRVGLLRVRVGDSASPTEQKAYFVLEILQDLCVGINLTRTKKSLSSCLQKFEPFGTTLAKVFRFAGLSSYNAYPSIIIEMLNYTTSEMKRLKPLVGKSKDPRKILKLTQQYMQLIEICLQLHYELRGKASFPIGKLASSSLGNGKIRLIGVSSHKLQLLSYFLKTDSFIRTKITTIKLLRLGKLPSKELRKYLEHFLPFVFEDTDKETSELAKSDSVNLTLKELLERVESTLRGEVDKSSTCQLDFDTSVILALQSSFLQDTMLSQSGECCFSTPAKDFAQCLLNLKDLEKIVLIGSILSSETICELARNLKNLPQLKRLDLRLNKQIDDAAFLEVTRSASSCKSLVDLRLSMYKVTLKGYDDVTQYIEGDQEGWKRLKKLFLLHGSPAEGFVIFLSKVMMYLKNVEVFHIAALNPSDVLSPEATNRFGNVIKLMKSLKKISIENMVDLKTAKDLYKQKKTVSSKDQKLQDSSIDPPCEGELRGVPETYQETEEGFQIIPEPDKNLDEEARTEEPETTQV